MRALVTGAAGLIGAHIVRALLDRGDDVRALVRATSRRDSLAGLSVQFVTADLLHPDAALDAACADCDLVFHAAVPFVYGRAARQDLKDTTVAGTEAILQSSARMGVRRIVVTSSSVVFGYNHRRAPIDETAPLAADANEPRYVAAKLAQHRRALELGERLGLAVIAACPTMTLGPTSSRLGPSNGLIVGYLADPFACTFPGGCNLVAARDVALGHLLVADYGVAGDSYLLGSENLTWRQIHTEIAALSGVSPPRLELNHTLAFLASTADEVRAAISGGTPASTREQAGMVGRYYWYSHAKAAALGYRPAPAREVLIETISWLAASPHITRETRARMHLAPDIHRLRRSAA